MAFILAFEPFFSTLVYAILCSSSYLILSISILALTLSLLLLPTTMVFCFLPLTFLFSSSTTSGCYLPLLRPLSISLSSSLSLTPSALPLDASPLPLLFSLSFYFEVDALSDSLLELKAAWLPRGRVRELLPATWLALVAVAPADISLVLVYGYFSVFF